MERSPSVFNFAHGTEMRILNGLPPKNAVGLQRTQMKNSLPSPELTVSKFRPIIIYDLIVTFIQQIRGVRFASQKQSVRLRSLEVQLCIGISLPERRKSQMR